MTSAPEQVHTTGHGFGANLGGKYLTFCLGPESYGIAVLKVREIISMLQITPVPKMPDYLKGVINLRGRVIPVIDLRVKFHLRNIVSGENNCIIVVQVADPGGVTKQIGMIVDAVEEVANLVAADLEAPPEFGTAVDMDYILAMAKVKGKVKMLLDIDRVISAAEITPGTAAVAA